MAYDLLIRNARLVLTDGIHPGDLAVSGGKIEAIGDLGNAAAVEIFEAEGLTLMPGVIDTQVHFREPGLEHKEDLESGTRAALMGGVTSILEMPNTSPTTTTAEALADKLARAKGRAWCHYGFFVGASTENAEQLGELEKLPGVPGIKIFMGSSTGPLLVGTDEDLEQVLRNGSRRMPIHAEDEPRNVARKSLISDAPHVREHPFLRDDESAILATRRILAISEKTGRPVHILHISTHQEPGIIADAKRRGLGTTAEVTPQHLWFAGPECYDRLGTLVQMNPPIRSAEHREGLWRALAEGVFDVFGSDHAPHTRDEKAQPYPKSPSGMPGVQTLLPVLLTFVAQGKLSLETMVKMACENPARLYGIEGKGRLDIGLDADFVLIDPNKSYVFEERSIESKCGWSPYTGETLTGSVEAVFLGGRVAVRDGQRQGQPEGQMLRFGQPSLGASTDV